MVNLQFPLQIIGITFGLVMLYITFLYYRKNAYTYQSLGLWSLVWLLFIIAVLLPGSLKGVLQTLHISRALDFFVIAGMFFFAIVVFYLFITVKRSEKRVEHLIAQYAKEHPEHVRKKRK